MSREQEELELAAAAVELSQLERLEEMPAAVRAKIEAEAARLLAAAPQAVAVAASSAAALGPVRQQKVAQFAGWFAAAACFALAVAGWFRAPREVTNVVVAPAPAAVATRSPSAADLREELVRTSADKVQIAWIATKDPGAQGATGDVVWSNQAQRGYMRFHGLAGNDATKGVYQLWIFDKERDARYPVDGGVFSIDDATKDVIVPITAKVQVHKPTLFAVTVEAPGGVVVSKREHIVVTASAGS
jgi:hypothetical protein